MTMELAQAITERAKNVEVSGALFSQALMDIRAAKGWVWRIDVKGSRYRLNINWRMFEDEVAKPAQEELSL